MTSRDRLGGAFAALAVQVLLGWLLVSGLDVTWRRLPEESLAVFRVVPPAPPRTAPLHRDRDKRRVREAPSPPSRAATATPIVVPPVVMRPLVPPPIEAALQPATGPQPTTGADLIAGIGTGAGGVGDGTGGGGGATSPRQTGGTIRTSDYPPAAFRQLIGGIVDVRYLVDADGHVIRCELVRSSGNADLDQTTCRLVQERFRFKPARDANGRKTTAWVDDGVEWIPHPPPSIGN